MYIVGHIPAGRAVSAETPEELDDRRTLRLDEFHGHIGIIEHRR